LTDFLGKSRLDPGCAIFFLQAEGPECPFGLVFAPCRRVEVRSGARPVRLSRSRDATERNDCQTEGLVVRFLRRKSPQQKPHTRLGELAVRAEMRVRPEYPKT